MNKTAGIIIIGNEILSGRTQDVNVAYIARRLADLGIQLKEVRIIPDDVAIIIDTVNKTRAAFDYVFTTGGIGPTHDDITSDCIAAAFGVPNEIHEPSFKLLESHYGKENFNTARQRMAHLPRGAEPIVNLVSLAPGYRIGNVYVMAGVPRIMQAMFEQIAPTLQHGQPIISKSCYGYNVTEGQIAHDLTDTQNQFPQVDIGSYPFYESKEKHGVTLVIKGQDQRAVNQAFESVYKLLQKNGFNPCEGEPVLDN